MIKLTFCLTRLAHLSRAEFQDYWRNHHAPLVKSFQDELKIKRYVQVHALADELSEGLRGPRGAPHGYDGIAELWWDKPRTCAAAIRGRARRAGPCWKTKRNSLIWRNHPSGSALNMRSSTGCNVRRGRAGPPERGTHW